MVFLELVSTLFIFASPDGDEFAFVTFGDGSTANYLLTTSTYFGITSTLGIKTIDVGLIDGGITGPDPSDPIGHPGNFAEIDNLTIGAAPVPEPAGWLLLATVTGLVALLRRNGPAALRARPQMKASGRPPPEVAPPDARTAY